MSAELYRRALSDDDDIKMFRTWIEDLETVIEQRDARIRELEESLQKMTRQYRMERCSVDRLTQENRNFKHRLADLEAGATVQAYTPADAPLEFTETPGTYVPLSKATEAQMRARQALLQIDAKTIAEWEATEQALRRAAEGLPPSDVDNPNSKQDSE